jgi:hypothetical protein
VRFAVGHSRSISTQGSIEGLRIFDTVRQCRLKNLRAKNYQGSDEEWVDILAYVFAQNHQPGTPQGDWEAGLEIVATVKEIDEDEKELVITLRKRIDGITVGKPFSWKSGRTQLPQAPWQALS